MFITYYEFYIYINNLLFVLLCTLANSSHIIFNTFYNIQQQVSNLFLFEKAN